MKNIKWITKEIRSICKDGDGYVKLIQLIFVGLVFASFIILLIYNLINPELTSKLDIFLTVVVGLMGTIIGTFFSERALDVIKKESELKSKALTGKATRIKEKVELLDNLLKKIS